MRGSDVAVRASWQSRARPSCWSGARRTGRTHERLPRELAGEVEGVTGEYFERCHVATPSKRARDDDEARRLWALGAQLCGVTW